MNDMREHLPSGMQSNQFKWKCMALTSHKKNCAVRAQLQEQVFQYKNILKY